MKRTIGIMGNISAGKTTLCKLIENRWDYVFYPEEVDELVLNFYYGDRRKHAYNTQVFFLSSRFRNWWHMTISPHSGVTDRIKEEDIHIFTEKNYRDAFLSKSEKMILAHQFDAMKHNIPEPDLNELYEEFYPRYQGNKLRIESNEWKLVNGDGSIRYDSEEADKLLQVIKDALGQ